MVYVDNDIYLNIANVARFEHTTPVGIKAIFILLSKSDLTRRQAPISWDKLLDMMVAPVNRVFGLTINTRLLTVGVPHDFLINVINNSPYNMGSAP